MRNIIGMLAIGLACVAAASCGNKHQATRPAPARVDVSVVKQSDINASRVYSGTIEESSGSTLSFGVPGTLQKIYVGQGDYVSKGQLIAVTDPTSMQNAYDIAQATLKQAQDAYNRMKILHDSNSLPEMQWVEVQNELQKAQSAAAIAKKGVDDTKLYSPISGYVSQKFVDPGMTVAPGVPVVKVVSINPIKVNISIPENEISEIELGAKAKISVGSMPDTAFVGTVTEKGVSANPISRSYDVKVTIDNPDGKLLPGMICDAQLLSAEPHQAIILPNDAVLIDANNENFVWLVKNGAAYKQIVEVEGMDDAGLIVSSGVAEGDTVIVEGQQKVSQGAAVDIINK